MASDQPAGGDFRKILETHRELMQLLDRIDRALSDRASSAEDVVAMLGQLGDRLIKHFELEEEGGYFAEALTGAPRLIARANDLLRQHPKMSAEARELVELSDRVSDPEQWWATTRDRFQAFRAALLEHEQREDGLVQEAYQRDLGAQD